MTKDKILSEGTRTHCSPRKAAEMYGRNEVAIGDVELAILSAMDEYAKQQSIVFNKHMDENAVRTGPDTWTHKCDNFKTYYTSEQLYSQFIEQQNKDNG